MTTITANTARFNGFNEGQKCYENDGSVDAAMSLNPYEAGVMYDSWKDGFNAGWNNAANPIPF